MLVFPVGGISAVNGIGDGGVFQIGIQFGGVVRRPGHIQNRVAGGSGCRDGQVVHQAGGNLNRLVTEAAAKFFPIHRQHRTHLIVPLKQLFGAGEGPGGVLQVFRHQLIAHLRFGGFIQGVSHLGGGAVGIGFLRNIGLPGNGIFQRVTFRHGGGNPLHGAHLSRGRFEGQFRRIRTVFPLQGGEGQGIGGVRPQAVQGQGGRLGGLSFQMQAIFRHNLDFIAVRFGIFLPTDFCLMLAHGLSLKVFRGGKFAASGKEQQQTQQSEKQPRQDLFGVPHLNHPFYCIFLPKLARYSHPDYTPNH